MKHRDAVFLLFFLAMIVLLIVVRPVNYRFGYLFNIMIYASRPWWDVALKSEEARWQIIPNLGAPKRIPKEIICASHNFSVRPVLFDAKKYSPHPQVFDVILFNLEWDILEIRINELQSVVEKFVILESICTFTGRKKNETFRSNAALKLPSYSSIERQIFVYNPEDNCRAMSALRGAHHRFDAEIMLRSHVANAVMMAGAKRGDLIAFSDVDEIPRMETLNLLKLCDFGPRIHLALDSYRYSFEHRLWPEFVYRSTVTIFGRVDLSTLSHRCKLLILFPSPSSYLHSSAVQLSL